MWLLDEVAVTLIRACVGDGLAAVLRISMAGVADDGVGNGAVCCGCGDEVEFC